MEKREAMLHEFARARLNEEAVSIERVHFYKTDRSVNPKRETPFWTAAGQLPILLSAPHAVRYYRQKKIRVSDEFTGSIVYLLNKLTGCHAIAAAKLYGGDPNYDNPCIYKERVAQICEREKIKLIIDIHGAAREREFDIEICTDKGKTMLGQPKILEVLEQNLRAFGLSRVSYDQFANVGSNTLANYASCELKLPAIQVEINKQYRVPGQNPQGFHRMLAAIVESIRDLS